MDQFVARANIDHYLNLLHTTDASAEEGSAINKLLIEELNKLGRNTAQLEFTETRAASCRRRFDQMCQWRDGFAQGSGEREKADRTVAKLETTLQLVEGFCHQMRRQLNGSSF